MVRMTALMIIVHCHPLKLISASAGTESFNDPALKNPKATAMIELRTIQLKSAPPKSLYIHGKIKMKQVSLNVFSTNPMISTYGIDINIKTVVCFDVILPAGRGRHGLLKDPPGLIQDAVDWRDQI